MTQPNNGTALPPEGETRGGSPMATGTIALLLVWHIVVIVVGLRQFVLLWPRLAAVAASGPAQEGASRARTPPADPARSRAAVPARFTAQDIGGDTGAQAIVKAISETAPPDPVSQYLKKRSSLPPLSSGADAVAQFLTTELTDPGLGTLPAGGLPDAPAPLPTSRPGETPETVLVEHNRKLLVSAFPQLKPKAENATGGNQEADTGAATAIEKTTATEKDLLLAVLLLGALGASARAAVRLATFVGLNQSGANWISWHFVQPFVGAIMALFFYLIMRGGPGAQGAPPDHVNVFLMCGLCGLAGLFARNALLQLERWFDTNATVGRAPNNPPNPNLQPPHTSKTPPEEKAKDETSSNTATAAKK